MNTRFLKIALKYKNHPSIIAIQNQFQNADTFYFVELEVTDTEKEIIKLNTKNSDIATNLGFGLINYAKKTREDVNNIAKIIFYKFENDLKLSSGLHKNQSPEEWKHVDLSLDLFLFFRSRTMQDS